MASRTCPKHYDVTPSIVHANHFQAGHSAPASRCYIECAGLPVAAAMVAAEGPAKKLDLKQEVSWVHIYTGYHCRAGTSNCMALLCVPGCPIPRQLAQHHSKRHFACSLEGGPPRHRHF